MTNKINFHTPQFHILSIFILIALISATTLLCVGLIFHGIFFPNFLPSLGLTFITTIICIIVVKIFFSKLIKKRFYIILSIAFTLGFMLIPPYFIFQQISKTMSVVNFYLIKDKYIDEISKTDSITSPKFIKFKWTSLGWEWLFFDESNGFDNNNGPKSKDWWLRAKETEAELTSCDWWSEKLADHFYRVSFYCEYPYKGSPIPAF